MIVTCSPTSVLITVGAALALEDISQDIPPSISADKLLVLLQ